MPRRLRVASGGYAYHVLNRAVGRARIFRKERDYEAFEEVLFEAKRRVPMRILAWCVMPNHWHLTLWPCGDGQLSEFSDG
jgi:putative transposase